MKKIFFGITVLTVIVLAACEKTHTIPDRFTPIPQNNSNVKFINMSPGSPQVNFYVNNVKSSGFNPTSAGVETGLAYPGFFPSTIGYATVPSGNVKIDAVVAPSSTVMTGATLISTTQTFEPSKFYSLVLLDTVTQMKAMFVQDDPSVPDQTKAYMRVGNFLADTAIKVVVTKTSPDYPYTKTYNNVTPRSMLPFDSLGAGTGQVYKIEFFRNSNNALVGSITNFAPSQTKKYTMYIRGAKAIGGVGFYTTF